MQMMAEMKTAHNAMSNSAMSMSLPNELKEFNKQLSILERMIDKKLKVDLSLN